MPGEGSESSKQKSGHMLAGSDVGGGGAASSALPPRSMLSRKSSTGNNQWGRYSDEEDWESLPFSFSPWGR